MFKLHSEYKPTTNIDIYLQSLFRNEKERYMWT